MVELCVCAVMPRLDTSLAILVVAHPFELEKPTNTGRLVSAVLSRARLTTRDALVPSDLAARDLATSDLDDSALGRPARPAPALLYPSEDAVPLETLLARGTPPSMLVVPDGTYRQARRLAQRHPLLRLLPRVVLPAHHHRAARLRRDARPDHLSTFEAVARAVGLLESTTIEAEMMRFFELFVQRTLWSRGAVPASSVPGGIPEPARRAFGAAASSSHRGRGAPPEP